MSLLNRNHLFYLLISPALLLSNIDFNAFKIPIYYSIKSGIGYDSNFLKISDDEKYRFNINNELYDNLNNLDSQVYTLGGELKYKPYIIKKHKTIFQFNYLYNLYTRLSKKSYHSFKFSINQHVARYQWIKISYSYIPDYYLRPYRDKDNSIVYESERYQMYEGCSFDNSILSMEYSRRLSKKIAVSIQFENAMQYFTPLFTEFDLNITGFGLGLQIKPDKYRLKFLYQYSNTDNITKNEALYSTEFMDRSYKEHSIKIYYNMKSKWGGHIILKNRNYISNRIYDQLHVDRWHNDSSISLWMKEKISKTLNARITISYRNRSTQSDYEWVKDLKSYNKYNLGVVLTYKGVSEVLF